MHWLLISAMLLCVTAVRAQTSIPPAMVSLDAAAGTLGGSLPDSPGEILLQQANIVVVGEASLRASGKAIEPCSLKDAIGVIYIDPGRINETHKPCSELVYPYQRFLNANVAIPLMPRQKAYLALHEITDPASVATIVATSAISIGADSHSAYGPGLKGFGKIAGVTLLQDATGQFFGTFLIPSIAHQDPRYYRMPQASIPKRLLYSVSRTLISRHDDGTPMLNYATLLTYPITAETSNLYVPGIQTDAPSTTKRIVIGLALDPVNNLIAEFLPDLAKRVHVRVIFVQQILNHMASGQGTLPGSANP